MKHFFFFFARDTNFVLSNPTLHSLVKALTTTKSKATYIKCSNVLHLPSPLVNDRGNRWKSYGKGQSTPPNWMWKCKQKVTLAPPNHYDIKILLWLWCKIITYLRGSLSDCRNKSHAKRNHTKSNNSGKKEEKSVPISYSKNLWNQIPDWDNSTAS